MATDKETKKLEKIAKRAALYTQMNETDQEKLDQNIKDAADLKKKRDKSRNIGNIGIAVGIIVAVAIAGIGIASGGLGLPLIAAMIGALVVGGAVKGVTKMKSDPLNTQRNTVLRNIGDKLDVKGKDVKKTIKAIQANKAINVEKPKQAEKTPETKPKPLPKIPTDKAKVSQKSQQPKQTDKPRSSSVGTAPSTKPVASVIKTEGKTVAQKESNKSNADIKDQNVVKQEEKKTRSASVGAKTTDKSPLKNLSDKRLASTILAPEGRNSTLTPPKTPPKALPKIPKGKGMV